MGKREAPIKLTPWEEAIATTAIMAILAAPMQSLCERAAEFVQQDMRTHGFNDLQEFAAWERREGGDSSLTMAVHAYLEAVRKAQDDAVRLGVKIET